MKKNTPPPVVAIVTNIKYGHIWHVPFFSLSWKRFRVVWHGIIFYPRMLIENVVIFLDPNPTKKIFPSMCWQKCHRGFLAKIVSKKNVTNVWFQEMGATKDICKALLLRDFSLLKGSRTFMQIWNGITLLWNNCTLQYKIDFNWFLSFKTR